ncbi:hypothetical protein KVR01_003104 [Diaporthe batatas]|uniref:uncharacterized protein n=1 Tax=Diaporthe batatas TaxID=748121 RepID=UPI001D042C2B|nr:uncharacterized protein KVR01_003104 [Diaporthe batatas]KAG8167415.1 hypothetical protein KVR01_003104 [Diaporthe batatas]
MRDFTIGFKYYPQYSKICKIAIVLPTVGEPLQLEALLGILELRVRGDPLDAVGYQKETQMAGHGWVRPAAQAGPGRTNDWLNLLDPRREYADNTEETARGLQALYASDGSVHQSFINKDFSEPRGDGTSIYGDLGPTGTELVYIPAFWIDSDYSGNGIGPRALNLFYRLSMGGVLSRYNIGGRVTFTLTPGLFSDREMVKMWFEKVPRRTVARRRDSRVGYEDEDAYEARVRGVVERRLVAFYRAQGYTAFRGAVYGRPVEPQTADPHDRRIENPNPPPLGEGGNTPRSRMSRDEAGPTGAAEGETQEDEEMGS